jgi:hypothetical protein
MKVQVYANAITKACERRIEVWDKDEKDQLVRRIREYSEPYKPEPKIELVLTGFWLWKTHKAIAIEQPIVTRTEEEIREKANSSVFRMRNTEFGQKVWNLFYISRHKRPETLIEMTAEELAPIAEYLSVFESERI